MYYFCIYCSSLPHLKIHLVYCCTDKNIIWKVYGKCFHIKNIQLRCSNNILLSVVFQSMWSSEKFCWPTWVKKCRSCSVKIICWVFLSECSFSLEQIYFPNEQFLQTILLMGYLFSFPFWVENSSKKITRYKGRIPLFFLRRVDERFSTTF